jgi:N-acetylmuramoyl-L-alanine amidase
MQVIRGITKGRAFAFVMMLLAACPTTSARAASISGVDVAQDKITLMFDAAVAGASAFVLDGPQRLAIDVRGARPGNGGAIGGLVSKVRHGQFDPSTARVVFDLVEPAIISGGSFAPDGRSLTLSIKPTSKTSFASAVKTGRMRFNLASFSALPPRGRGIMAAMARAPQQALYADDLWCARDKPAPRRDRRGPWRP